MPAPVLVSRWRLPAESRDLSWRTHRGVLLARRELGRFAEAFERIDDQGVTARNRQAVQRDLELGRRGLVYTQVRGRTEGLELHLPAVDEGNERDVAVGPSTAEPLRVHDQR